MITNLLAIIFANIVSIYSFSVNTINQGQINLSDYQGKKILLVNISTQSSYASQIQKLQQLYTQYQDSLVIIAFPSGDFSGESYTNEELASYLTDSLHVTFPVAVINNVSGQNMQPVYQWLANRDDNGALNFPINMDFEKCLINSQGKICGVFTNEVDPMDTVLTSAIENYIPQ